MKLLLTSFIFTFAAARIHFKTPQEEARMNRAGKRDKNSFLRDKFQNLTLIIIITLLANLSLVGTTLAQEVDRASHKTTGPINP